MTSVHAHNAYAIALKSRLHCRIHVCMYFKSKHCSDQKILYQVQYTKSVCVCVCGGGGGQSTSGPIYEKWGGGSIRFRSDTFVWHTENTLALIINGYNFDRGGCSSTRSTLPGYVTGLNKLYIHVHVPTYILPRYTSHARANELNCRF